MTERREPLSGGGYQRPQQPWQCGLADEGPPCPLGPDARGQCPAASACHPVRDGDRWHCNRSPLRGGPCATGPSPDGACAIVYRCTPVRSLRSRRGRFVLGVAAAALGAACMTLSGPWRNELIAPGPLSVHHAQLLKGERESSRCAQCHAAGGADFSAWWAHSAGREALGPAQAVLCLECHGKTISKDMALVAHNAPGLLSARADGADTGAPRRDPAAAIACSACHREHQGSKHNLTAIADKSCHACHRQQFGSFGHGHPEFAGWPYQRPTRMAFDHASHNLKHFPAEKQPFACAACHEASATGERQLTRDYATSCAGCHDKSLIASLAEGMPLLALPTVDVDALQAAGYDVEPWPAEASGDFDGAVPMPATLLLAADPRGAAALASLGSRMDFLDVDPGDAAQVAVAADAARALKDLVNDLADQGQAAVAARLKAVLNRELTSAELEALAGRLSPDAAAGFRERWFGNSPAATDAVEDREALRARVAAGGWVRDDQTLSLRYHPIGHADPWLHAWLDVLAEAANSPRKEIAGAAEPLLRAALKPTASGQCGSCHRLEHDPAGRLAIHWRPLQARDALQQFTTFDHSPHVIDPQLSDCTSCHRIEAIAPSVAAAAAASPHDFTSGFAPLTKSSCVKCHTPRAAGESCTQCHKYHGGSFESEVGRLK